jgi:hypothetical protein
MVTGKGPRPASAEQRLQELGIQLPTPPEPFGIYAEAVQTGDPAHTPLRFTDLRNRGRMHVLHLDRDRAIQKVLRRFPQML